MTKIKLFDLVCGALPSDFNPATLRSMGKNEWWEHNEFLACAYALRNCPSLNWQAYLRNYPDVKEAGIDPVLHFLHDGLFEGRLLFTGCNIGNQKNSSDRQIKVSVIVCNYNKAHYLPHSLDSVLNQTLKEIEIIVVDDGSTDESLDIIQKMAAGDPRIKIIEMGHNQSLHRVRQEGVAAANGQYIMFLDSDDFYLPDSCATAYNAIYAKYDFVCFNTNLLFPDGIGQEQKDQLTQYFNCKEGREYKEHQIVPAIYAAERSMPEVLWNKIYSATLCKAAFAKMERIPLHQTEDIYETMVIASLAHKAARIAPMLYTYRVMAGQATAENTTASMQSFACAGDAYVCLEKFLSEKGLVTYRDLVKTRFLWRVCPPWLKYANAGNCRWYFNSMARQYGIIDLLGHLIRHYNDKWQEIAEKFQYYGTTFSPGKQVRSVGILYTVMGNGGAERVMWDLAALLTEKGYNVTVFLESSHENDLRMLPQVNIVYLAAYGAGAERTQLLLRALDAMLKQHPVDVMTCHACHYGNLLWQVMLLKYRNIPVIFFPHSAFFKWLLYPGDKYTMQMHAAVMRLGDKVSVLSHYEELYYRQAGADAQYIPNPVRQAEENFIAEKNFAERCNTILAFGRFGEPTKNVMDCLYILQEIIKKKPLVKMTFVGSFINEQAEKRFYNSASSMGLLRNIHVTGWIDDARPYFRQAALLLSTTWHESFALTIAEAQSHGLPVVMYDLPIEPAEDNPAIIQIEHGNIKAVAKEIVAILSDQERWHKLSKIAHQKMKRFGHEFYIEKIISLLENFDKKSDVTYYKQKDYQVVMRTLAFYGAHLPPWQTA